MKPAGTQTDKNMEFDGIGQGPSKASNKYAGNQSGLTAKANYGRGPTKGNLDIEKSEPIPGTREGKRAPDTSGKSSTLSGSPDSINVGSGPRGGGREWAPKAGQNYRGNADRQNVGRGPTKGNE